MYVYVGQLNLLEAQVTLNRTKRKSAADNTLGTEQKAILAGIHMCMYLCMYVCIYMCMHHT